MARISLGLCILWAAAGCEARNGAGGEAPVAASASESDARRSAMALVDWLNGAAESGGSVASAVGPKGHLRIVQVSLDDSTALIGMSQLSLKSSSLRDYNDVLESQIRRSTWEAMQPTVVALDDLLSAVMIEAGRRRNEQAFVGASLMRIALIELEGKYSHGSIDSLNTKKSNLALLAKNASIRGDFYIDQIP